MFGEYEFGGSNASVNYEGAYQMFLGDNIMYAIPEISDPSIVEMDSLSAKPRVMSGAQGYDNELTKALGPTAPIPPARTSAPVLGRYETPVPMPITLPGYEALTTEPAGEYAAYSQGSVKYYSIPDADNHYAVPISSGELTYSSSAVPMVPTHGSVGQKRERKKSTA